jgi:hypothetical protein
VIANHPLVAATLSTFTRSILIQRYHPGHPQAHGSYLFRQHRHLHRQEHRQQRTYLSRAVDAAANVACQETWGVGVLLDLLYDQKHLRDSPFAASIDHRVVCRRATETAACLPLFIALSRRSLCSVKVPHVFEGGAVDVVGRRSTDGFYKRTIYLET